MGIHMIDTEPRDDTDVDVACIARWRGGDQQAATELVERHAEALARFAVRLGVRDDVDDVVQDTFIRAFAALDGFRSASSFRTWLFSIERRVVLDRHRRLQRHGESEPVNAEQAAIAYDALDELVADETSRRVARAVARLSPMQRDVFLLRVHEGRSYREIADVLGTSEGAARVHYHNAMRSVREFLHE